MRGWLADLLLKPLALQIEKHFTALHTARPGARPILYLRLEFRPGRDLPLLRLPWELLHQHRLTNGDVHVGRYLRYEAAPGRLDPAPKLHLLVLESDPADDALPRLHPNERERIAAGLKGTKLAGRFQVSPVVPGYRAAQKALHARRGQPAIFHFAGHGDFGWRCEHCRKLANTRDGNPCGAPDCGFQRHGVPMGFLAFTDPDTGRADWVSSDGLRNLLKQADVRLVVLNACKSAAGRGGADVFNGLAQQLMDLVPAVIATPFPLETQAAEEFAGLLYQGLGEGLPLVEALHQVQQAMAEPCPDEWYRPVLYLRSRQGDGERLLETAAAEPVPAATGHATDRALRVSPEQAAVGSSAGIPVPNAPTGSDQGEDRAGPTPLRPGSRCPDPATQSLADALDAAYLEEEQLACTGADTVEVRARILTLKRRIREGGRLRIGDFLLHGRYKLVTALGRGGFATIYQAFDTRARRLVAVKVLHGQYGDDKSRVQRFFRGARKMAELQHQGIVQVIEPELVDEGHHFFVMEFLPGGDLRQCVLNGGIDAERALDLTLEVGAALAFAHGHAIIHRDIKPANIVLDRAGSPKLTDFDLVHAGDTTGGTRTGVLGTFGYAAPEQMQRPQDVDARADVYGLGMTAVFALHGADPSLYEILRNANGFIDSLAVFDRVKPVLSRSIAWEVGERYPSVADFCAALREARQVKPLVVVFGMPPLAISVPAAEDPPGTDPDARPPLGPTPFRDQLVSDVGFGPEMIWLPGSTFRMGSPAGVGADDERPAHDVTLRGYPERNMLKLRNPIIYNA